MSNRPGHKARDSLISKLHKKESWFINNFADIAAPLSHLGCSIRLEQKNSKGDHFDDVDPHEHIQPEIPFTDRLKALRLLTEYFFNDDVQDEIAIADDPHHEASSDNDEAL